MAGPVAGPTSPPTESSTGVAGWAGLLVPYDQPSVDGRIIRRPPGGARIRDLPIELKYQEAATCGHDNALIGLAAITHTWETEDGLWGSGPFDMQDPRGSELARKVHQGFVGHVSVDLGDFKTSVQQQTGGGMIEAVTDWKLLSTTIVADAAMDGARIFTVDDPARITPMAASLAARREAAGVFSVSDTATLTFAGRKPKETEQFAPDLTLTVTGASDLPWAARDTTWDAAGARRRMAEHCGGKDNLNANCFGRGFLYRDSDADAALLGSYKFPFADVINGRVRAVFRGVASAAANVDKGGITTADKEALRGKIRSLYGSAARAFNDSKLIAPFDADTATLRTVEMAETDTTVPDMPEVDDQVAALAAEIVKALEPRMADAIASAIAGAIDSAVTAATGGAGQAVEPEVVLPDDEEVIDVEDPDATAMLSSTILRMARAVAVRKLAGVA